MNTSSISCSGGTQATIEDLASKNGTLVGGIRISAPRILEAGESIQVGPFALTFHVGNESMSTETQIAAHPRPRSREA